MMIKKVSTTTIYLTYLLLPQFFGLCDDPSVISPIPIASTAYGDGIVLLDPSSDDIIRRPHNHNKVQRLDIYGECMCPDYRAFEEVETQLPKKYKNSNLQVVLHLFPLPFHHASYIVNQAALGLTADASLLSEDSSSPTEGETFRRFRDAVYNQQHKLGNHAIANKTMNEIMEQIGDIANSVGLSKDVALASMVSTHVDEKLRTMIKSAWQKGVSATPSLSLNGAPLYLAGADEWTLDLLSGVIDPFILFSGADSDADASLDADLQNRVVA